jgi:hypothetical protein
MLPPYTTRNSILQPKTPQAETIPCCQAGLPDIFLEQYTKTGEKYQMTTKLLNVHTDVPNGRKIFQMAINY